MVNLNIIGWICFFLGGLMLGRSIGGPDMTITAAAFYAVAVAAFGAREALEVRK